MSETVETKCVWESIFDVNDINSLDAGLFLGGIISIIFGLWINTSILTTKLRVDRSYKNLANFTLTACFRRIFGVFSRPFLIDFLKGSDWEETSYKLSAFLETYLAVLEIEWLTHVAIERYVVAKYNTNGWPINNQHYNLFGNLCIFFAILYSFLPIFGIGRYGYDLTCDSCTFDMILPNSWWKYCILALFLMRSVKPVCVMFLMLLWARILESKYVCSEENTKQQHFTTNIIFVVFVNLTCWAPIAMIRGIIVISQLLDTTHPYVVADANCIKWAMWAHWISPAATTITLCITDDNIRNNMLSIYSKQEEKPNGDKDKMI